MKLPYFLFSRILRRKLAMERTPLNRFTVRLARDVNDYWGAFRLVQSAYVATGIEGVLSSYVRMIPQHVLPESYVVIAEEKGQLVATMTVTLDSPAGLPLDKDYPAELGELRAQGLRLCEFGSLAVVSRCRRSGVTNLLNMAAVSIATRLLRADCTVIGVNPNAVDHYRAIYNFTRLGVDQRHAQLVAPVAALKLDLHTMPDFMDRAYRRPLQNQELPGQYFFGAPLECIQLPQDSHEELKRWKMSREVFQEIFLRRTNYLEQLDVPTRQHLEMQRTPRTIGKVAPDLKLIETLEILRKQSRP